MKELKMVSIINQKLKVHHNPVGCSKKNLSSKISVKEFIMVNLETRPDKINFQHTCIKSRRDSRKLFYTTSY